VKTAPRAPAGRRLPTGEMARLRARLAVADETLRAIRTGEVDTLVVAGRSGPRLFTLKGAEHPYRELMESMNEGALTLTADKTILYANQCFARLVRCPLEQVIGGSLRRFLPPRDRAALRSLMRRAGRSGGKIQALLQVGGSAQVPVQISVRPLAGARARKAAVGLVVTDMTEARRIEELLRALARRVVQVQEAERGRVARELHDNITQPLCAVLFRSEMLVAKLAAHGGAARAEALKLRDLAGQTAREVERISRNLRPGVLEQLGLLAVLRTSTAEFTKRTGVAVALDCAPPAVRLTAEIELTLYRILQDALDNVARHARARHVKVALTESHGMIVLVVDDDGAGFNSDQHPEGKEGPGGLGLLGMRERASYVGGTVQVKSGRGAGTEIEVSIPLPAEPGR